MKSIIIGVVAGLLAVAAYSQVGVLGSLSGDTFVLDPDGVHVDVNSPPPAQVQFTQSQLQQKLQLLTVQQTNYQSALNKVNADIQAINAALALFPVQINTAQPINPIP